MKKILFSLITVLCLYSVSHSAPIGNINLAEIEYMPIVFKPFNVAVCATETTIWTPATGKKFRMMGFSMGTSAAGYVDFKDNTAGTTIFTTRTGANIPVNTDIRNGILSGTANYVLTITSSVTSICSGTVWGIEE